MSKAFKVEGASAAELVVPPRPSLPVGQTNYVTARGLALLRVDLERMLSERARVISDRSGEDLARSIESLAVQLQALEERVASARLVDQAAQPHDEVRFGARVTVRTEEGRERRLTIVGVDEAEPSAGRIAFVAPLARALLGRRVGDIATVRTPRGEQQLEVTAIDYAS